MRMTTRMRMITRMRMKMMMKIGIMMIRRMKTLILSFKLQLIIRNHKEVKSARDPIVGPPDRPGSRVHCPAPVLTRPLNPHLLVQI